MNVERAEIKTYVYHVEMSREEASALCERLRGDTTDTPGGRLRKAILDESPDPLRRFP